MLRVKEGGFALPTVLIASAVMLIILVVVLQSVVSVTVSLQSQRMAQFSKEASSSGITMARACLVESENVVTWAGKELTPSTDCAGNTLYTSCNNATTAATDARCWVTLQGELRSTFSVPEPTIAADGKTKQIASNASVERVRSSTQTAWRTIRSTTRAQAGSLNVAQTAINSRFACSLTANSQVYCWGFDYQGGKGPNAPSNSSAPSRIDTAAVFEGKVITALAQGGATASHMCAIAGGEVYCWGSNTYGQLGDGNGDGMFAMSPDPVKVVNGTGEALNGKTVTEVTVGDNNTCAIASSRAYCWGSNAVGQLGNNNSAMAYSAKPVAVSGMGTNNVTDISNTQDTSCAVANAEAYCWGWGVYGQIGDNATVNRYAAVKINGGALSGKTVTGVQTGHAVSCAIANTGTTVIGEVYCWGQNGEGAVGYATSGDSLVPAKVVNGSGTALYGQRVLAVSGGYHLTCAVTSDGTTDNKVICWGYNGTVGQLGRGIYGGSNYAPAEVPGLPAGPITSLATGSDRTCVVIAASTYCWGAVYDGQVRYGVQTPTAVSTSGVLSGKTINHIAAGGPTSCASATDGVVACWGSNIDGTVGDGTKINRLLPVASGSFSGKTISDLSVGERSACTVASGEFWCWGQNIAGKLGNGAWGNPETVPVKVDKSGVLAGKTAQLVTVPSSVGVSCGVATNKAYCWGGYTAIPSASALGNNLIVQSTGSYATLSPVSVYEETGVLTSSSTITDISANGVVCVIANAGSVYCWGVNQMGQLGANSSSVGSSKPYPVLKETGVLAGKTASKVAVGANSVCVSTTEPNIYCWGYNYNGQFGDGTRVTSLKPVLMTNSDSPLKGKTITKLSAGSSHACAATSTNEVYCWGSNALGQVGDGTNTTRYYPVQVQGPLVGKTITDLYANVNNTCAVASGKAYCWGSNDYGQIGDGTSQVSASASATKSLSIPPFLQY